MIKYTKILLIINVLILLIAVIALSVKPEVATVPEQVEIKKEIVVETKKPKSSFYTDEKKAIAKKIASTFPENKETMVAIGLKESGLNKDATSYNCYYKTGGDTYDSIVKKYIDISTVSKTRLSGYVSTFCRKGHEKYAWSKDGGVLQVNKPTDYHYTVEGNLATARIIYDNQGLSAWTAYNTGAYKKYLPTARELLNS